MQPFASAEEAWFWHLRCAEFVGKPRASLPDDLAQTPRPCQPHEIFREMCIAYRTKVLTKRHVLVLAKTQADGAIPRSRIDVEYFEGAMAVLEERLRRKGIVQ